MNITEHLERLERLLIIGQKNILNVDELCLLLNLSESRVRALCSERNIPYYKQGKNVFFKRSEIEEWQLSTRIPTNEEIEKKAATYIAVNPLKK